MALDLLFSFWLILSGLLGFRDGSVRKLVSLLMTGVALIVGHLTMRSSADVLIDLFALDESVAPVVGFLCVFVGIVLIQSIVYKIATESYKIGGIADRVAGSAIGLFQGILFLSSLLFILSFLGVPSRTTRMYSKIYKSVVNVAPQILDLFTTVQSGSFEMLDEMTPEKGLEQLRTMVKPGEAAVDSVRENRLLRKVAQETAAASQRIDSLRSAMRR